MNFKNTLELNQSQKLILTTQLKQSLAILNMSRLEVEEEIRKESESNPLLEAEKNEEGIDWEKYIKHMESINIRQDKNDAPYSSENAVDFENMIRSTSNLYDYLIDELKYFKLTFEEKRICKYIIDSLDEDGYLRINDKEIYDALRVDASLFRRCLDIVQQLDPPGIGARNISECLILQLERMGISNNIVENIIMNDLELIGRNKLKDIAKKYKISIEKCKEAIEIIRHLDPKPGRACSNDKCVYVQPDVIVDKIDGKYIVHTNEKDVYNIKINDFYRNMMTDKDSDKEAKEFIKDRLNSAATLIKNIESRKSTILRIAEAIIDEQQEFIQKGEKYIKPMKMKDIADKLEIHESTVSRGVNGKYMLTPFGLYEFKFFFNAALETDNSSDGASSAGIKRDIKDIIDGENKKKPLSDDAISKMLKEKGVSVARRTVAKYREELGIPSSSRRKEF
ncbi:RNA polymerase factor sigma-54 [Peptacetobacter hiranonis]|uniref:RNA polymerase sigma-54 factor n=1 Tax=Peptacetobacter hiranonis (strain DSM 13275 / JCM 10541 / KCTC 15199 / TO-931) TaxID=500633 RepID=B6FY84_PEPHT|nr:RNA polymerase factor sigma-54 [Peptacetobacter hiranonis]EEA85530.1 RNA polymerase sigma-54 factor [Peptacetobacter hiranonis DSM 13275]